MTAQNLLGVPGGRMVRHCGIVMLRQPPPTANATTFITLEDETGVA
jgi:error-prone DNA polymerase